MKTAILYQRVSTLEQSNKRYSVGNQKTILEQFCQRNNIKIIGSFQDAATGTNFNRDGFSKLTELAKKKKPTYVLAYRWDRWGRNAVEMLSIVKEFKKIGVEVNAVEQWKEGNGADDMFLLGLQAILAERESAVTSERIKSNIAKAHEKGIWLNKLPLGYRRSITVDEKGKRAVEICPIGEQIVKEVFDLFVSDWGKMKIREHIKDKYKKELKQLNYDFAPMAIRRILTNVLYSGMIQFKDLEGVERIVQGIHTPIIDSETFEKAQARMNLLEGLHSKENHKERDEYHLKSLIMCPTCNSPLRAYAVKKKLKKTGDIRVTHYYDCRNNHFRIQTKTAHDIFSESVNEISFSENKLPEIESIVKDKMNQYQVLYFQKVKEAGKLLSDANLKIEKLDEMLLEGLAVADYNRLKAHHQKIAEDAQGTIDLVSDFSTIQDYITAKSIETASNFENGYHMSPPTTKKALLKSVFIDGFYIDKIKQKVIFKDINLNDFNLSPLSSKLVQVQ